MTRINRAALVLYVIGMLALAVILLTGCSSSSSSSSSSSVPRYQSQYPANIQTTYLHACQNAGASARGCACSLNWWMNNISYTKFQTFGYDVEMNIPSAELSGDLAVVTKACGKL